MTKYLLRRLFRGLISIFIVVMIVMVMIYSMLDKNLIFASDAMYTKVSNNQQVAYKYRRWQEYGYIDYLTYADYINMLAKNGDIDEETRAAVINIGRKPENDSEQTAEFVKKFEQYCAENKYSYSRLNAVMATPKKLAPGGQQQLFAYRDRPLISRLVNYVTGLFSVDNIHYVKEDIDNRGLTFTLHDPLYGGDKFAPAVMGNGTYHKYLFYTDSSFPFIHQNIFTLNLGKSYSVNTGVDVFTTMTRPQGTYVPRINDFPGIKCFKPKPVCGQLHQCADKQIRSFKNGIFLYNRNYCCLPRVPARCTDGHWHGTEKRQAS